MKIALTCLALITSCSIVFGQSKKELTEEVAKLKAQIAELKKVVPTDISDDRKKASYGIGLMIASNLKGQGGDSLDVATLKAGLTDIYLNNKPLMEMSDASVYVETYMKRAGELKRSQVKNEGINFLKANKTKPGVMTTASGLQYKIITTGTGKMPTANDQVTVNYTGSRIDGFIFDSTAKSGKPLTYSVNKFITGWTEALTMMHEGDKWIIYVPSELGYGDRAQGNDIPANSMLIFEMELLKVN